jgi:hypothetical protein
MSLTPETVIIQKATVAGDGSGGKANTWPATGNLWQATRNFYRKPSQDLIDEGTHAGQGPGVTVKTKCFFTFEGPQFPVLLRDKYRIVGGDGVAYRILHVRQYDDTLQVDCEAFD